MSKLLINIIKRRGGRREEYGLLSGYTGIVCNLLLCVAKFVVGSVTGAISVTADAVNNLTDSGVNIVTIAGTKLANKPVDKEHPFGHGRAEYISALIVAMSIFLMCFELFKSSVQKIIHPEDVRYSRIYILILALAVCVKLWMAFFNKKLFSLTDNLNLKAVMKDSLNDCVATGATIAVLVLSGVYGIKWVDGVTGCAVAVFVLLSGVEVIKDILPALLGQPPSKDVTDRIESIILSDELILGVHDLILHNYGPGRTIASAHAEVPSDTDLTAAHEAIDRAEQKIMKELGINICIHTDPVAVNDSEFEKYKTLTEILISEYNADFTFHDFRLTENGGKKVIAFDLVTPFEYESAKEQIKNDITRIYGEKLPNTELSINIEHSFTEQ